MRVYHLTSSENALADIALRRIKIARIADLNDPFELLAANLGNNRELRRAIRDLKSELSKTNGLLCFSKQWKSPVLWSHYADKHRGICLGFELKDELVSEVKYSPDRLAARFKNNDLGQGLEEAFVREMLLTKYVHWQYEEEIRMFVGLDPSTVERGLYFSEFSDDLKLKEVILGPLCDVPIERVRRLVTKTYDSVAVIKARLAFKWFAVVPDERSLKVVDGKLSN